MQRKLKRHAGERGVSLLLVTVCITVLFGTAGLAIDAGHMFVIKQRAQTAADAGAQAGAMDIYRGLNNGSASATAYAQKEGFTASEIAVAYPSCSSLAWCNGHVTLSGTDSPNLIQVTITRVVPTTFMRALGVAASTVTAVASAAISLEPQPIPILVLHPTLSGSFSKNGSNTITICGGPTRAIQINSASTTSINISGASGTVDLSHAGPLDTAGNCTNGTGADFANVGLQNPFPGTLLLGTTGHYVSPASPIKDPLLTVAAPAQPAAAAAPLVVCGPPSSGAAQRCPVAQHNCPAALGNGDTCSLYAPGYYASGINISGRVFAQFRSGVYWINHGGFKLGSNSVVRMALTADDNTRPAGWTCPVSTVACMLVYNSPSVPVNTNNDIFSIGSNSGGFGSATFPSPVCPNGGNCLVGSPTGTGSTYAGILFFQSHATQTNLTHDFSGGGGLSLTGTIYLTHTAASTIADGTYQSINLQGNSGGSTKVQGEIITDVLSLGGTSGVTMNLIGTPTFQVRQVALVQ